VSVIGIEGNQGTKSRVLVIPVEGILRKEVGGQLNPDGFYLYRTLSSMYRVILVTYESDRRRVTDWLDKEGIFNYDDLLLPMTLAGNWVTEGYWTNIIRILRMRGYNISLVVVNGPQDALDVTNASVPVLMYSQPSYALPEWLPDTPKGALAWNALVDKIETEREVRLNDKRMEEHIE
jgi:hypothetical protein